MEEGARWQQAWEVSRVGAREGCGEGGEGVERAVLESFVRSTLQAGDSLGAGAARVEQAVEGSSDGAIWFTSSPIAASASRPIFQAAFLAFTGFFIYTAANLCVKLEGGLAFQAAAIRFRVLQTRSGTLPDDAQLGGLGLLLDGCRQDGGLEAEVVVGWNNGSGREKESGIVGWTEFGRSVRANGYYFETWGGPTELDPVRWVIESRAGLNGSGGWSAIGSSGWEIARSGDLGLYPDLQFQTPMTRHVTVPFDHRPLWIDVIAVGTGSLEWALALLMCVAAGRFGRPGLARYMFLAASGFDVLAMVVVAVGRHALGETHAAVKSWLFLWAQSILFLGISCYEARMVAVFMIYGVVSWACETIVCLLLHHTGWMELALNVGPNAGTATFFFGIAILYFRRRVVRRARRLVLEDKARYDALWEQVCQADGATVWISELRDLASALISGASGPPRQQAKLWSGNDACTILSVPVCAFAAALGRHGGGRRDVVWEAVECLDQLYVQAACLHPILLAKVCQWASGSQGLFAAEAGEVSEAGKKFVTLEEAAGWGMRVKFARLKAPRRAVEKLGRSYGQDVSQLVDVCRQSVVFRDGRHLLACLTAIAADPDTQILRVKNRLDPTYDSNTSAGYRDVGLNLRIDSLETRELGADGHVCEVQLLLLPFAEVKSAEGHRRYVTFRNLRGE